MACAAARAGRLTVLKAIVRAGADVNARANDGTTPVIYAAASKDEGTEMVRFLIDHGADPTVSNKEGWTALLVCPPDSPTARLLRAAGVAPGGKHPAEKFNQCVCPVISLRSRFSETDIQRTIRYLLRPEE